MNTLLTKLGVASTTSVIVTEAVKLDTLWSALISLAISIVSVLAVEGINYLRVFLTSKTKKLDDKSREE